MFKVPFVDIRAAYLELKPELDAAYDRVMSSGRYILGREVHAFEEEFAAYCGTRHCIGVASGLDALTLILRARGIGAGDEVLVPSNTFIATWLAVKNVGAVPVPVEADAATSNLDPANLQRAVTSRARAVIPVHLYGQPADMDPLHEIAQQCGLQVIEDAAQAHGALYKGRRAGSLAEAAAFSFYPSKNLGSAGDGGAVTTGDSTLAEQVRVMRNYGSRQKYHHEISAANSRLDELQAAFLRVKLRKLDEWNARRAEVAWLYLDALADVPGLSAPQIATATEPAWHLFVIRHRHRDALARSLREHGVETMMHYPIPPHLQPGFSNALQSISWDPLESTCRHASLSIL